MTGLVGRCIQPRGGNSGWHLCFRCFMVSLSFFFFFFGSSTWGIVLWCLKLVCRVYFLFIFSVVWESKTDFTLVYPDLGCDGQVSCALDVSQPLPVPNPNEKRVGWQATLPHKNLMATHTSTRANQETSIRKTYDRQQRRKTLNLDDHRDYFGCFSLQCNMATFIEL